MDRIAIRERINELRAKQRKYQCWEALAAHRAHRLMQMQSVIEDMVIALEYDYALATKEQTMAESDKMWQIRKFLERLGI